METNYMIYAEFREGKGWESPRLCRKREIALQPGCDALWRGRLCTAEIPAACGSDGIIRLFRVRETEEDLREKCRRKGIPSPDEELLTDSVRMLSAAGKERRPENGGELLRFRILAAAAGTEDRPAFQLIVTAERRTEPQQETAVFSVRRLGGWEDSRFSFREGCRGTGAEAGIIIGARTGAEAGIITGARTGAEAGIIIGARTGEGTRAEAGVITGGGTRAEAGVSVIVDGEEELPAGCPAESVFFRMGGTVIVLPAPLGGPYASDPVRDSVLRLLESRGIPVQQRCLTRDEFPEAQKSAAPDGAGSGVIDEIFVASVENGVRRVSVWNHFGREIWRSGESGDPSTVRSAEGNADAAAGGGTDGTAKIPEAAGHTGVCDGNASQSSLADSLRRELRGFLDGSGEDRFRWILYGNKRHAG